MRVKIASDGTSQGTTIVNAETGEVIKGVTAIEFSVYVGGVARATIQLVEVPIEFVGDAEIVAREDK